MVVQWPGTSPHWCGTVARPQNYCAWNKHDCGGLFMRWSAFSDRRYVGRITMDKMTRRAFGAAGFVLLVATSATFAQQQSSTVRVRGTVEGVDGPMLTVKSRDGQTTYKVKIADNVAVRGVV